MGNQGLTGFYRFTRARLLVKKLASVLQHRGPKRIPTEGGNMTYINSIQCVDLAVNGMRFHLQLVEVCHAS